MAKSKQPEKESVDGFDKLLGVIITSLCLVAFGCLVVYLEGTLTQWLFNYFHPTGGEAL